MITYDLKYNLKVPVIQEDSLNTWIDVKEITQSNIRFLQELLEKEKSTLKMCDSELKKINSKITKKGIIL